MWGKAEWENVIDEWIWITPTHVGKRYAKQQNSTIVKDHPHPCGEKRVDDGSMRELLHYNYSRQTP